MELGQKYIHPAEHTILSEGPARLPRRTCDNANLLRFRPLRPAIMGPPPVQIPHTPLRRNDLQSGPTTPPALRKSDRDDVPLPARALHFLPGHLLPHRLPRHDRLWPSRRAMAAALPGTVDGDQPGRFLGVALAPGVQAVLRRLRREAGRPNFRTGGRRHRRFLRFGNHARLWRVGFRPGDGAVLRDALLRYDGRRLRAGGDLEREDGDEGTGPVGLVLGDGVDVLLGQLDCGCVGEKGSDHQ